MFARSEPRASSSAVRPSMSVAAVSARAWSSNTATFSSSSSVAGQLRTPLLRPLHTICSGVCVLLRSGAAFAPARRSICTTVASPKRAARCRAPFCLWLRAFALAFAANSCLITPAT
eukprot:CAMPEP_0180153466 /NCGR_PEP_ID=MMETSP0986-20121125/23541_1 /TAXON_ID=697907 /ORGANISM="non described non described, Strain CCMP2293" /LENGTH=116 /DNA_ID=CAMNT_0022101557 /DNA_START=380 /DNA_END=730 /DNA_ORIENTATION=+